MNKADAVHWIAFATRTDIAQVASLDIPDDALIWIGQKLSHNKLLNPPRRIPIKTAIFPCLNCGQSFMDQYVTKKPMYCPNCRK